MNYSEAREFLKKISIRGSIMGLEAMECLCGYLENPQQKIPVVHIAGTNGKGSTGAFLSTILSEAGYRVGRYVSPAVFEYEEMIQIYENNVLSYISKEEVADAVSQLSKIGQKMEKENGLIPTIFELETAMAFLTFVSRKCDIAIVEAGLGGLWDATNVIAKPELSVITRIALDHTGVLGNTITEIAKNKAGIIKMGCPVVSAPQTKEAKDVLRQEAEKKSASLTIVDLDEITGEKVTIEKTEFCYQGKPFKAQMLGCITAENASLAIESVRKLKRFPVTEENIFQGIYKTTWKGRFQVICHMPITIVDGAHNPDGARALVKSLKELFPHKKMHGIMAVFADKDYTAIAEAVVPHLVSCYAVPAKGERSLSTTTLEETLQEYTETTGCFGGVREAYDWLKNSISKDDGILIFGTLSILDELSEINGQ